MPAADSDCCMQVVKFFERILYASDEREAKEAMLEAQTMYGKDATNGSAELQP